MFCESLGRQSWFGEGKGSGWDEGLGGFSILGAQAEPVCIRMRARESIETRDVVPRRFGIVTDGNTGPIELSGTHRVRSPSSRASCVRLPRVFGSRISGKQLCYLVKRAPECWIEVCEFEADYNLTQELANKDLLGAFGSRVRGKDITLVVLLDSGFRRKDVQEDRAPL